MPERHQREFVFPFVPRPLLRKRWVLDWRMLKR